MSAEDPGDDWIPVALGWSGTEPTFHWVRLDGEPFHESFFEDTVARLLRRPFNRLLAWPTSPAALRGHARTRPDGLVFHGSRCGSTLWARMLGATGRAVVLSEAPVIDEVLRVHSTRPVSLEARIDWLRGVVGALGRPRRPGVDRLLVKLDSWSLHELATVAAAFPGVPWVFLYRDPIEVLASHAREPGVHMVPGMLPPAALGLDAGDTSDVALHEYRAIVLGRLYEAAAEQVDRHGGVLVNASEIPDRLLAGRDPFALPWTDDDRKAMGDAARFDSKNALVPFDPDARAHRTPPPELLAAAERHVGAAYRRLEARRVAHPHGR